MILQLQGNFTKEMFHKDDEMVFANISPLSSDIHNRQGNCPRQMFDEDNERDMVVGNKDISPLVPVNSNLNTRVLADPNPLLSTQLQRARRLSEYFPASSYSEEGNSVHVLRTASTGLQPNAYHDSDSLLSLLLLPESCDNVHSNHVSKLHNKLRMKSAEVDLSYMRESTLDENYLLGLALRDHGALCLNMELNFAEGGKIYQSDVTSSQQDPMIMYQHLQPPEQTLPLLLSVNQNNSNGSTPFQDSGNHFHEYPDLELHLQLQQHDRHLSHTMNTATDFIRLQGHAPVLEGSAAAWVGGSKCHQDMKQRQNEPRQAFLDFLKNSNALAVSNYCRPVLGEVQNLHVSGNVSGDGHGHGSVSSSGLHNEVAAVSCSLPASQARYATSNFQDDMDNMPQYTYSRDNAGMGSELGGIYSNSVTNSSLSYDRDKAGMRSELGCIYSNSVPDFSSSVSKDVKFTTSPSPCLIVQPAHDTGEVITPPRQDHSSPILGCNYDKKPQLPIRSRVNSSQAVEPKTKEIFKAENSKKKRDFLKERYKALESLVPRYSKSWLKQADRASTVGDTVNYIHVLHQQIKELTLKNEQRLERKKTERSQTARSRGFSGECSNGRPRSLENTFADFCNSNQTELRLTSKHGTAVRFQLMIDELHADMVQKREPYFLNRLLTSVCGFDLVSTSGGIIKNHDVLALIFKLKGNLRGRSVEIMAKIMKTLDHVP